MLLPSSRRAVGLLLALSALSACTSGADEVDVEGFAPGTCTDAADAVQDVDEALRDVEAEDLSPEEAGSRLRAAQDVLKPIRDDEADGQLAEALTEVITQAGLFRIAVDSNNYDGSEVADVRTALEALAAQCTVE